MSFDISKTVALVKGGLMDPNTTWNNYLGENPAWKQTALVLTGPLIVANIFLSLLLSRLLGGFAYYGYHSSFLTALVIGLVMAAVGFTLAVLVFNFLAGPFKGEPDFSRAFAAVSLAAIPAWIAGIVGALIPWVGWLIALAGGILSLVFMYRILPLALKLPDGTRLVHFIVSLLLIIILNGLLASFLGRALVGDEWSAGKPYGEERSAVSTRSPGFIGELQRQGEMMDEASSDVFDPPQDGKLTGDQVETYVGVLRKTRIVHEKYAAEMKQLSEEIEAKKAAGEQPSPADLSKMYGGIGKTMSANNAEMEVVKTAGGNWAEHLWVKEQLRVASIQQGEGSEANAHNFALYQEYEDRL